MPARRARRSSAPGAHVRLALLVLVGCRAATPDVTVLSTGTAYASLAEAIDAVADDDAICVGPGTYDLADSLDCRNPYPADDFRSLRIVGAGSERTRLVGHAGDARSWLCHDL